VKVIPADDRRNERELPQFNLNLMTVPIIDEWNQTIGMIHAINSHAFHGSTLFGLQNRDAI
jgi:hypothetical protein